MKAQIHSGARGKAGGIKLCSNEDEVRTAAKALLGKRLVTHQTGPEGRTVHRLYVEAAVPIEREIYLGFVLDRKSERVMIVASAQGGMEIEEIAQSVARGDHPRHWSSPRWGSPPSRRARSPSRSGSTRRR